MIPEDFEAVTAELAARDKYTRLYEDEVEYYGEAFRRIREGLSEDDQGLLDAYIHVIEAKADRLCRLTAAHYAVNGADIFKKC